MNRNKYIQKSIVHKIILIIKMCTIVQWEVRIVANLQVGSVPRIRCLIPDRNNIFITTRYLSDRLCTCTPHLPVYCM